MRYIIRILFSLIIFTTANLYSLGTFIPISSYTWIFILIFAFINIMPSFTNRKLQTKKLRNSGNGCELLKLFLLSTAFSVIYSIVGWAGMLPIGSLTEATKLWLLSTLFAIFLEAFVFWNGIIRIYATSSQLGLKWRVIGIACGLIPIVHLIVLSKLIRIADKEVSFENAKILKDNARKAKKFCQTKYPILLVHGVFFRDFKHFNYWGRIPKELEKNGAKIFYGNHQSASSVKDSARELDARIRQIIEETNCEKVNIIAHSKGGLDCRYALSMLGTDKYVASLTTINTPHRGCEFADHLLFKIPQSQKDMVADTYNRTLRKIGDPNPDFLAAVSDLTAHACEELNEEAADSPAVYYQSVGSKLNHATSGRFPLNFTYQLVKSFDGLNDGLVGEDSFPWGDDYKFIATEEKRGISHGDMIDLNRENFDGFDVREFYVELVHDLKEKGY